MGFFSGIGKAVKSVFKGVGKIFKSVWSGVKKFASSKIGKIILIAAAIWLGGAAAGLWNSGFASIDGALIASQAGGAATTAATAAPSVAAEAAAEATGGLMGGGAVTGAGAGGVVAPAVDYAAANTALTTAPIDFAGANAALTAPLTAAPKAGLIGKVAGAIKGTAGWISANPIPSLIGGNMLMSAFTPNELDVLAENKRIRDEDIARGNANVAGVAGIPTLQSTGKSPYPQTPSYLTYPHPGLMNRSPA